jgi:hypothetical protein
VSETSVSIVSDLKGKGTLVLMKRAANQILSEGKQGEAVRFKEGF